MNRSGITIIEVLISIAVIGIIVAAFASLQITNLRATRDAKLASSATEVATQAMEEIARQLVIPATFITQKENCLTACSNPLTVSAHAGYTINHTITYNPLGLLQVEVNVDGQSDAYYAHYISCTDVNPAPTVKDPAPCPG